MYTVSNVCRKSISLSNHLIGLLSLHGRHHVTVSQLQHRIIRLDLRILGNRTKNYLDLFHLARFHDVLLLGSSSFSCRPSCGSIHCDPSGTTVIVVSLRYVALLQDECSLGNNVFQNAIVIIIQYQWFDERSPSVWSRIGL